MTTNFGFSNAGSLSYHGTNKSDSELITRSTYEDGLGWRFGDDDANPWKINSDKNNGYPYLYWQK
ncbi:MAG: hypothetical protein LBQ52_03880 [Helicobacteraceae bacterium]|jgi:hypothetical protein|nr:hypothetical protein [Helicobacteraceae bacterium]